MDEVDRVSATHFDTKILPRIGPTAYGGEVTEGKHLGRTIRWRTVRPVVIGQPTGSSTPFNEEDIDFRVSALPHAVVK